MKLKEVVHEDFTNYKKPSMFLIFPFCHGFKCGAELCQNSALTREKDVEVSVNEIVDWYINNPITHAVVCGGLEPFDSANDLIALISSIRARSQDDIVIYTGYTEDEVSAFPQYSSLLEYKNIIIKFGRFVPNAEAHYDEILGVKLVSPNQYGKKVS